MDRDVFGNPPARQESVGPPGTPVPDVTDGDPSVTGSRWSVDSWTDRARERLSELLPDVSGAVRVVTVQGGIPPELRQHLESVLSPEDLAKLDRGEPIEFGDPAVAQRFNAAVNDAVFAGPSFRFLGELSPEQRRRVETVLSPEDMAKLGRGETIHVPDRAAFDELTKLIAESADPG